MGYRKNFVAEATENQSRATARCPNVSSEASQMHRELRTETAEVQMGSRTGLIPSPAPLEAFLGFSCLEIISLHSHLTPGGDHQESSQITFYRKSFHRFHHLQGATAAPGVSFL